MYGLSSLYLTETATNMALSSQDHAHPTNLPPLGQVLASTDPPQPHSPEWCHPWNVFIATTLFFCVIRLIFGGGNYICCSAWYALCFFIPFPFVFLGAGFGGLCVPLFTFDWQCLLHLGLVLLYCQIDLVIGRWMVIRDYGKKNESGVEMAEPFGVGGGRKMEEEEVGYHTWGK